MAQKCVHKGCGKKFTDPDEDCIYHPGPPIFHEGQKGVRAPFPTSTLVSVNTSANTIYDQAGNAANLVS